MRKIICFVFVLLTGIISPCKTYAVWPDFSPLLPFSSQFCPMCIPPAIGVAVSYVDQVKALREDLNKYTDMTLLKQMATSYAANMGSTAFNKWKQKKDNRRKMIKYARTIKDSSIADLRDEASVKDAFVKLFMQYPSKKTRTKEAYKTMGEQLKMDTTLEMYLTAVEMEKELYGNSEGQVGSETKSMEDLGMLRQIDMIESCLLENKNCEEIGLKSCMEQKGSGPDDTKEDQVCFWNSALQAEKLYDTIMKYNLMLVAMHAQYQAVSGINQMAQIREYEEEDKSKSKSDEKDKSSMLYENYLAPFENTAYDYISADAVFADLTPEEEKEATEELSGYESGLATSENVIRGNFEDANNPQSFTAVLDERADDVESLKILEEVRGYLNSALKVHNMKQTLPEYKKVYKNYDSAKKQMEQAQRNLEESGECIINMLKPYYDNPDQTWFGENCAYYGVGQIICHYTPEKSAGTDMESDGLFDMICPGDIQHNCYVQELHAEKMPSGIAKYLFTLYATAKDEDAVGDIDSAIQVSESQQQGEYAQRTTVALDNDDKDVSQEDDLFVTARNSDEQTDENLLLGQKKDLPDGQEGEPSTLKNQAKGDEEKENARKDSLIRWVIGSEVSKELALDLDTGENEWGSRKAKFPLWTDQIYFYDRYIDGKYANIEEYIRTMPFAEVLLQSAKNINKTYPYQEIAGIPPISAEQQRQEAEQALDNLEKKLGELYKHKAKELVLEYKSSGTAGLSMQVTERQQIENAIKAEDERFANIRKEHEKRQASKKKELEAWYQILDQANTKISELNQQYNQQHEKVKQADSTTAEATEGVEYGQEIYTGRQLSQDSPQNKEFKETQKTNAESSEQAKLKMAEAENNLEKYEKIAKRAEEMIVQIKKDLEQIRTEYVRQMSDAEASAGVEFSKLAEKLKTERQINVLSAATAEIIPLGLADRLAQCARNYALTQVSNAKSKLDDLKTDQSLYYVEYAPNVQEIHRSMIEKITNIKAQDLTECTALEELSKFMADTDENVLPAINILADVCKNDFCKQEDSAYFVGALGVAEDFSAPKSPLNFSSAPVREVFHFDIIDFNNLDKYYQDKDDIDSNRKVYISAETFLDFLNQYEGFEYGGETYGSSVPEVWKYILKRHAFVQKTLDLAPLLGESDEMENLLVGDNDKTLLRSGVYPCISNGQVIDIVKTGSSVMYYNSVRASKDTDKNLPECRGISLTEENGKTIVADSEAGGGYGPVPDNGSLVANKGSELGTILAYIPEFPSGFDALLKAKLFSGLVNRASFPYRLTFNNDLLKAISIINKTENIGDDLEADLNFYQANRVMYEHNQFGDYLDQVEYETITADEMRKIENQISEIRAQLGEIISVGSFEMGEEFDLLNDDDYNQAAQALDEEKKEYMDVALQKLQSLPQGAGQSKNVRDKHDRLMHEIAVLQADSEEVVTLKGDEELDELEEKIKNSQADMAVEEKFAEATEAEEERQRARYRHPYCASYQ